MRNQYHSITSTPSVFFFLCVLYFPPTTFGEERTQFCSVGKRNKRLPPPPSSISILFSLLLFELSFLWPLCFPTGSTITVYFFSPQPSSWWFKERTHHTFPKRCLLTVPRCNRFFSSSSHSLSKPLNLGHSFFFLFNAPLPHLFAPDSFFGRRQYCPLAYPPPLISQVVHSCSPAQSFCGRQVGSLFLLQSRIFFGCPSLEEGEGRIPPPDSVELLPPRGGYLPITRFFDVCSSL